MSAASSDETTAVVHNVRILTATILEYFKRKDIALNDRELIGNSTEQFNKAPHDLHWFYAKSGKAPSISMANYFTRLFCYYVVIYSDSAKIKYISPKEEISDLEGLGSATMGGALLAIAAFTIFNLQKALRKYQHNVCTHRLFGVIFVEAMKFNEDKGHDNKLYAQILGISTTKDLNALEQILFFTILDGNLGYSEKRNEGKETEHIEVDRTEGINQIKKIANQLIMLQPELKNALGRLNHSSITKDAIQQNSTAQSHADNDSKMQANDGGYRSPSP